MSAENRKITDIKSFSVMKKCASVDKVLSRYADNVNEEIKILKTLLALRIDSIAE